MKKSIILTIVGLLLVFVYFLIEPVFSMIQLGEDISEFDQLRPSIKHQDDIDIKADDILVEYFDSLDAPSLSIAIGVENELVWANAVGYASIETKTSADTATRYRVGSISKSLTSVGLGKLLENGKLELNSTAGEYVPYVSGKLSNLTVQQLASHTAGIRNYGTCMCLPIWEFTNNDQFTSVEASISVFGNDDLLFEPGTDFSYSTYNYTLLSGIMEGAAKKDFLDYMKDEVFTPLSLSHTAADYPEQSANRADSYEVNSGTARLSYPVNNSNKWAGGGFLSTPSDLVKFGNAVLNYELLDSTTTNLLFTPILLAVGEVNEQNYGLGWRNHVSTNIIQDHREVRMYHHGGSAAGGIAMLILLPEYNVTVAATMNRSGTSSDLFKVVYRIAELFILEGQTNHQYY
ncbi:MAG: serine hydrolase domain-containing protein [Bacteroidota bacterium]